MSKTILQALLDEVHYPVGEGFAENKLLLRGLSVEASCSAEVLRGSAFIGATADCLMSLVTAPSFSEGDKSISLSERGLILKRANALYRSIGEQEQEMSEREESSVAFLD